MKELLPLNSGGGQKKRLIVKMMLDHYQQMWLGTPYEHIMLPTE